MKTTLATLATLSGCALLAATLSGCSSGASASGVATGFQTAGPAGCMQHQKHQPTTADTGDQMDTAHRLTVLKYYTARGDGAFCDGKGATASDLAWMRFYVAEGADPSHVSTWLTHP